MNIDEFYAENPVRKNSGEADYGVWWLEGQMTFPRYRVSYIQTTGEVYAINHTTRGVQVLGVVPADNLSTDYLHGETYYATLDKILAGWEDKCGQSNGLQWIRERLRCCTFCGSRENLMDEYEIGEKDCCWECNDEIRREEAINDRADREGKRY
jgi:hypothetical protein